MHNNFITKVKETKMANKKIWVGILVIVLVFGITVVGLVFPVKVSADDLWANVPNLDLLNGIWKGSYNQTQNFVEVEKKAVGGYLAPPSFYGDLKQTIKGEATLNTNASAKTVTISGTNTITFSGEKINTVWDHLKKEFEREYNDPSHPLPDGIAAKLNDVDHSFIFTFLLLKLYDDTDIRFQINQNGEKIKVKNQIEIERFNMDYLSGYSCDGLPPELEIIMTKQ